MVQYESSWSAGPVRASRRVGSRLFMLCLVMWLSGISAAFAQDFKAIDAALARQDAREARVLLEQAREGNEQNVEWLWRMARLEYQAGREYPEKDRRGYEHYKAGLEHARKALALNERSGHSHAWYARLRGQVCTFESTEAKIKATVEIKDHTLKAMQLNPRDDDNYHAMGRLNYALATLSWIERKAASLLFATPPEGSLDEAVRYFRKAIDLNPRSIVHYLWLARSLVEQGRKDEAKTTLDKALQLQVQGKDDRRYLKEVKELREGL